MRKKDKNIVVGMSGGVDSSVAAYLLKDQGYKITGLFMKNWQSEPGEVCTSEIDFEDASKVCDELDIQLHKANFSDEYWERVFTFFLSEHAKGRTPNPDILCNREIKFKAFIDYAKQIGATHIATGHYASLTKEKDDVYLSRSKDINKDQTYFLHEVKSKDLKNCIFPLSKINKAEVRNIASDIGLHISTKKDSVGICFVGERNLKNFLSRFIELTPGEIIDNEGNILGEHHGSALYTIGQRQGLNIGGVKNKSELPWYVYKKDINLNTVYVCQGEDNDLLLNTGLELDSMKFINQHSKFRSNQIMCKVQVRHRQKAVDCSLDLSTSTVRFNEKIRAIAPGQSAVFYDQSDKICIGGGIISKAIN